MEQDLDPDPGDKGFRIAEGVAENRQISIEDSEMRHGRKSASQLIAGFKVQVVSTLLCGFILLIRVIKANELCNRYGLDTISCGSSIAFATECLEKGLITTGDTDGLSMEWGSSEAVVELAR